MPFKNNKFFFPDIDECSSHPCENGGICIDLVGGFRCECPVEWTGDLCNIGKFNSKNTFFKTVCQIDTT